MHAASACQVGQGCDGTASSWPALTLLDSDDGYGHMKAALGVRYRPSLRIPSVALRPRVFFPLRISRALLFCSCAAVGLAD
jgi:hypothetical protein